MYCERSTPAGMDSSVLSFSQLFASVEQPKYVESGKLRSIGVFFLQRQSFCKMLFWCCSHARSGPVRDCRRLLYGRCGILSGLCHPVGAPVVCKASSTKQAREDARRRILAARPGVR